MNAQNKLDIAFLNATVQAAIQPMFWTAVALAALVPIAAAIGTAVAKKIDKPTGR